VSGQTSCHGLSQPCILSPVYAFTSRISAVEMVLTVLFSRDPQAEGYLEDAWPHQACFFLPGAQFCSGRGFLKPDLCQQFPLQPRVLTVPANHQNPSGLQGECVSLSCLCLSRILFGAGACSFPGQKGSLPTS